MSEVIGKISSIDSGKFYIKGEDGSLTEVSEGYEILEGQSVVGADSNTQLDNVIVSLADGSEIVMLGTQAQMFDTTLTQVDLSEPEVVTKNDAIQDLVEEYGDEIDIEDIETAAGEEAGVESSAGGEADFANFNETSTDVEAELKDGAFLAAGEDDSNVREDEEEDIVLQNSTDTDTDTTVGVTNTDSQEDVSNNNQIQAEIDAAENASDAEVADLYEAANTAADTANEAITAAESAADALAQNNNPTQDDIDAANEAIEAADEAITAAEEAATAYETAATDADEDVLDTTTIGSTDNAQSTLDDAVAAENASDAEVADLYEAANTAADTANEAITAAESAADALAQNNNPTQDDIEAANQAIADADAAIQAATDAKAAADTAATDAGEPTQTVTEVGSTDNAQSTLDDAVAAENASDAEVADLYEAANTAADTANEAITAAESAADALAQNNNPTQAQIDEVQGLIDTADEKIADATVAKETYETKAEAEGETVETVTAVGNTDAAVDGLNQGISNTQDDLTYVSENAGYKNVVGIYEIDENGNPTNTTVIIDNQNGMDGGSHLADLNPNSEYGFFIVPNGANKFDENSEVSFNTDGDTPVLMVDGNEISKVYHDTPEWSSDGKDHFVFTENPSGGMDIKIEDLSLGDADFDDVVLHSDVALADKYLVETETETNTTLDAQAMETEGITQKDDGTFVKTQKVAVETPMVDSAEVDSDAMAQAGFVKSDDNAWVKETTETFTNTRTETQEFTDTREVEVAVDSSEVIYKTEEYTIPGETITKETEVTVSLDDQKLNNGSKDELTIEVNGDITFTADFKGNGGTGSEVQVTKQDGSTQTVSLNDGANSFEDVSSITLLHTGDKNNATIHLTDIEKTTTETVETQGESTTGVRVTDEVDVDAMQAAGFTMTGGEVVRSINVQNVTEEGTGFDVTALKNGVEVDINTQTQGTNHDGFGVKDRHDWPEIQEGESIKLGLDRDVSEINVGFAWLESTASAQVDFIKDGEVVGTFTQDGGSDRVEDVMTLSPEDGSTFDSVEISAPGRGDDFLINSVEYSYEEPTVWSKTETEEFTNTREAEVEFEDTRVVETPATQEDMQYVQVEDTEAIEDRGLVLGDDGQYYEDQEVDAEPIYKDETTVTDTLVMNGDDSIDLENLDAVISDIEAINMDAGSQNIESLSVEDVLEVTDDNNMLRIDGDSSDNVELNSEDAQWALGEFKTDVETGNTYQEYVGHSGDSTVTLEISSEITVHES